MGPPPFFFFIPMLFMLLFWAVPIYFVVRWAIRVRRALETKNTSAGLPAPEQFERLTERLDSLADELERMRERQDFVERLLQAPKAPGAPPAVPPGAAPAGPAGNPPAAPPGNSPPAPGATGPI